MVESDSSKQAISSEDDKRDQLIAEAIIRISTLENILIAKKLITQEELSSMLLETTTNLLKHFTSQKKV